VEKLILAVLCALVLLVVILIALVIWLSLCIRKQRPAPQMPVHGLSRNQLIVIFRDFVRVVLFAGGELQRMSEECSNLAAILRTTRHNPEPGSVPLHDTGDLSGALVADKLEMVKVMLDKIVDQVLGRTRQIGFGPRGGGFGQSDDS
jgi:hypothetical protein